MKKVEKLLIKVYIIILFSLMSVVGYSDTYYVSSSGSDSNSGKSISSPWRTIDKLNDTYFSSGDVILFQRGDSFFGSLRPRSGNSSADVTYGAYGSGSKPMLHISMLLNDASNWVEVGSNIWITDSSIDFGSDVGNIIFNNDTFCGIKYPNTSDLKTQGDFMYDFSSDMVRMYSNGNPTNYYNSIRLLFGSTIVNQGGRSYITYDNLWLNYCGGFGFSGDATHHITIRDCDISWIGGRYLSGYGDGKVRCGNGVEFWASTHNNLVEGCKLWEIYDAALTNQSSSGSYGDQRNIIYKNNIIWNCEYSFEFFNWNTASRIDNIQFINNTCMDAGYGWGHNQRSDPRGYHLCFWDITSNTSNLIVENNIFYNSTSYLVYIPDSDDGITSRLTMNYNCLYQESGSLAIIENGATRRFYTGEIDTYKAQSGFGINSIGTDPQLSGFELTSNSDCIDAGNPDYPYDPDNTISDIGAIYFHHSGCPPDPPDIHTVEYVSICEGESYNGWTVSGNYERILKTSLQGDSIITTYLTVNLSYFTYETIVINEGENYNGWDNTGQYQRTLISVHGCDSVIETNLIVNNLTDIFDQELKTNIDINIYPNPACDNNFSVSFSNDNGNEYQLKDSFIEIIDNNGRVIERREVLKTIERFHVKNGGLYIIRIVMRTNYLSFKIIIF